MMTGSSTGLEIYDRSMNSHCALTDLLALITRPRRPVYLYASQWRVSCSAGRGSPAKRR